MWLAISECYWLTSHVRVSYDEVVVKLSLCHAVPLYVCRLGWTLQLWAAEFCLRKLVKHQSIVWFTEYFDILIRLVWITSDREWRTDRRRDRQNYNSSSVDGSASTQRGWSSLKAVSHTPDLWSLEHFRTLTYIDSFKRSLNTVYLPLVSAMDRSSVGYLVFDRQRLRRAASYYAYVAKTYNKMVKILTISNRLL